MQLERFAAKVLVFPHPYRLHKQFLFFKKNTFGILHSRDGVRAILYNSTAQRVDSKGGRREVRRPKAFTNSLPPWCRIHKGWRGTPYDPRGSARKHSRNFLNCISPPHKNAKKGNFRFLFSYQYSISESCSGSPSAAARKSGSFSIGIF